MLLKAVHNGLGQAVVLAGFVNRPYKLQRSAEAQAEAKRALRNLSLYQFHARPFCAKIRRAMYRLDLLTQLKDATNDLQARQALLEDGGKVKMPCLRTEESGQVRWMYEPSKIITYLEGRFANAWAADQRPLAAPGGSRWIRKCTGISPSRPGNRQW